MCIAGPERRSLILDRVTSSWCATNTGWDGSSALSSASAIARPRTVPTPTGATWRSSSATLARWWKSARAAWSSATSGNTASATTTMFGLTCRTPGAKGSLRIRAILPQKKDRARYFLLSRRHHCAWRSRPHARQRSRLRFACREGAAGGRHPVRSKTDRHDAGTTRIAIWRQRIRVHGVVLQPRADRLIDVGLAVIHRIQQFYLLPMRPGLRHAGGVTLYGFDPGLYRRTIKAVSPMVRSPTIFPP